MLLILKTLFTVEFNLPCPVELHYLYISQCALCKCVLNLVQVFFHMAGKGIP